MQVRRIIPYHFPLACIYPGKRGAEVIVIAKREKVHEVIRAIEPSLLTSSRIPLMDDPSLCVVQAFIDEKAASEVRKQLTDSGCGEVAVYVSKPMERGWSIDKFFFPLMFGNMRLVVMAGQLLIKAINTLRKDIGYASDVFLYHLGFNYGLQLAAHIMGLANAGGKKPSPEDIEVVAEYFSDFARVAGFALIEPVKLDTASLIAEFKMRGCWEAELYRKEYGKTDRPVCFFTRGNIAGVASYVLGVEMACEELVCEAMGADHCLVRLRPSGRALKLTGREG